MRLNNKFVSVLISVLVVTSMVLVGCQAATTAPVAPAAVATTAPAAPAAAPTAAGVATPADVLAKFPDYPKTLPENCKVAELEDAMTFVNKYWLNPVASTGSFTPVMGPADKRYKIGYIEGLGGFPDNVNMVEGVVAAAKLSCVDLVRCDSKYEVEPAINCAQVMKDSKVDGVINSNWQAPAMDAMAKILAGIPHVTVDVLATGVPFFGVDNCQVGTTTGEYLANWVKTKYTGPVTDVWVVFNENPDVGDEPMKRITCAEDAIKKALPEIPATQYVRIPGGSFTDKAFDAMTTWLTANPKAKVVLGTGINDNGAVGASTACDAAKRLCAVVGKGASAQAWAELDKPDDKSTFKASVDFVFFEYGRYELPAILDLIKGVTIPDLIHNNVYVLDRANMADHKAVRPAS